MDDAAQLLAWRNDPLTRQMSFNTQEVAPDDHLTWLQRRFSDAGARIYIVEATDTGLPLGVARLERRDDTTVELALTVAPAHRGRGLAGRIIAKLIELAGGGELGRCTTLVAQVRPDNVPSLKAFAGAGFAASPASARDRVIMTRPVPGPDQLSS
jgi:RimJ/RimL family protein N-acetyltransferase